MHLVSVADKVLQLLATCGTVLNGDVGKAQLAQSLRLPERFENIAKLVGDFYRVETQALEVRSILQELDENRLVDLVEVEASKAETLQPAKDLQSLTKVRKRDFLHK